MILDIDEVGPCLIISKLCHVTVTPGTLLAGIIISRTILENLSIVISYISLYPIFAHVLSGTALFKLSIVT